MFDPVAPAQRSWLAVVAAVALAVAACAGGGAGSPAPTSAQTEQPTEAASPAEETPGQASPAGASPGQPSPGGEEGGLFVAINKSADQQYFIDLQTAFTERIEELGGEAQTFNAELDPQLGVSLVNDAISNGARGIAITVPDQTIGPAVAAAAANAGVALIATDDAIEDEQGNPVPFVGFNGTDMGTKVGEEAARLMEEAGWLEDTSTLGVLSTEVQTLSVCEDRTNAAKEQMRAAGVPDDRIIQVPYDGETPPAQDAAGPLITAHPEVEHWVVFACNDEGVLGVLNALAGQGAAPENIIAVGLGAYEACKPWAADQESGWKAALFISGLDVGSAAADVLWNNVAGGEELPAETIATTTIVNAESWDQVMDEVSVSNCQG